MTALNPQIGILIQNDSGDLIPPRSIVVVTSVEIVAGTDLNEPFAVHHVQQYTGQAGNIFVTDASYINVGKRGRAYSDDVIYVAIDSGPYIPTPLVGEQWGPVPNTWTVSRGGMGFFCQGYADAGDSYQRAIFRRDRGWCWGKLTASLSAGSASSPTSATFDIWIYDPTSIAAFPPLIKVTATGLQGLTAGNWDESLTGESDYLVKVEQSQGILSFYWVGCQAS